MTTRQGRLLFLGVTALLLLVLPAQAQIYTVSLANGNSFETRYQPRLSVSDEGRVLILTDVGNWITLDKSRITGITSELESRGFGTVIDTRTVIIGWSPNDAPQAEEDTGEMDPTARLMEFLTGQEANRPVYDVQQFVEPEEAGMGHAGLPAALGNPYSSTGSSPR